MEAERKVLIIMVTCQNTAHTYCHTTCCQMVNISNYICTSNNIGKPAYIRYVCLQPFCHSIQITWRFIWEGAINRLCHLLHGMECKGVSTNKTIAASWMNHHIIWIGWQQGCTHVSWLHLFTGLNSAIKNSVINLWLKIIKVLSARVPLYNLCFALYSFKCNMLFT